MKKQILTFIAVFAIFYLMWSFYNVTFDFSKWSEYNRFSYLFLSSIFSGSLIAIQESQK